ncbi:Metallo-dependent phosphatase-like protein [Chaetomium tenue]|uniref:Metallo-dependent phosphatase-like protein n=1 Tax=Chaetomium tenue TaxID=1854479 RepID=A0ACB7PFM2_9PEZI|nr:Metallo-dependent phosphatase-like protein [Chaetomium globosum]
MTQDIKTFKTRFLILSDTHAQPLVTPSVPVDVAIHCGDLTEQSKMAEFRATMALLQGIDAPLKLVIAGNHDFTLDTEVYKKKAAEAHRICSIHPRDMAAVYGEFDDARVLLNTYSGIIFLDEGTHHFDLRNGARLTVYVSPFTPSADPDWGFQYRLGEQHDFAIDKSADVVITHSPPKGVLDQTSSKQRAGRDQLFAAVARARPRLHCFGHVHEGWGAKLVAWRGATPSENPSHFTDIDNGASVVVETLATLRPGKWDDAEAAKEKEARAGRLVAQGYRQTSHCAGDDRAITPGKETLFVNAAIQPGPEDDGPQLPWVVDIDLPGIPATPAV